MASITRPKKPKPPDSEQRAWYMVRDAEGKEHRFHTLAEADATYDKFYPKKGKKRD
jgi:hypothetical protein